MTNQAKQHAEIIQGLRNGDLQAWTALCDQFQRRLWQYISRLCGRDPHLVADIFQETLMAVAQAGKTVREDTPIWPWLSRIAHNQVALHWRRQYRAATTSPPAALESVPSQRTPEDELLQGELVSGVRNLLAEMKADDVTILLAKYLDRDTLQALADRFGVSLEAMRSRLARARREFRSRYESWQQYQAHPRSGERPISPQQSTSGEPNS